MLIVQKNILATSSEYWAQISKDRVGVRKEEKENEHRVEETGKDKLGGSEGGMQKI